MNRLILLGETADRLARHLTSSEPSEDGAFVLLREGRGRYGRRLLGTDLILPPPDAWERHGPDQLRPSAQWISAAISHAVTSAAGLLFVHSHPRSEHPPGLSPVDQRAFRTLADTLAPMLPGPFGCAVVHPTGWAGALWAGDRPEPIHRIMSVGRTVNMLSPQLTNQDSALDARQLGALGIVHDRLRQLVVGIVGCGGLGSPTAEQVVRMGVKRVLLVDHDRLDTESNVRRMVGSTMVDLHATSPVPKVDIVGRHLEHLDLGVSIDRIDGDVRREHVFRALLDMDVVFCGTDTHGSRAVLNDLASTYLLPVIDVGVRVASKTNASLAGLLAEVRVLTPTTPCLWCRGTINGDVIRAENLPDNERQRLEREGYVVGSVGQPAPSVMALTVLGSSLGTCALLTLLSGEGDTASSGYWVDGFLGDASEVGPTNPEPGCRCRQHLGLGDSAPPPFLP